MFSSKNRIDKMAMETGLGEKIVREDKYILKYNIQLPDIITDLQNKTNLTRNQKNGISYSKFRGGDYYSIKMFNDNELLTYLNFK